MDKTTQEQIDEINRKLDNFLSEYYRNNNPTSQTFTKKCYFTGGIDLSQSSTVTIGGASSTIGLYGVTPVVKASAISAPATQGGAYVQADVQSIVTAVNSIRTALTNIGITA